MRETKAKKPKIVPTSGGNLTGTDVILLRKRLGWSSPAFADLLSVSTSTLSRWEGCENSEIPADPHGRRLLRLLQEVLDKHPDARERLNRAVDDGHHRMLFVLLGLYYGDTPWMSILRKRTEAP